MGAGQQDGRGNAGVVGFFPAEGAQAPFVAGFQAREVVAGLGRGQVVAAAARKFEEGFGHDGANHVAALILLIGAAETVAVKAGHGLGAATAEGAAQDVTGCSGGRH